MSCGGCGGSWSWSGGSSSSSWALSSGSSSGGGSWDLFASASSVIYTDASLTRFTTISSSVSFLGTTTDGAVVIALLSG